MSSSLGSRPARKPGSLPFGQADVQAASSQAARSEEPYGVVRVHAVGAAAVGDDLAAPRKARGDGLQAWEWRRDCARDVPRAVLGLGPDVEQDDVPPLQAVL